MATVTPILRKDYKDVSKEVVSEQVIYLRVTVNRKSKFYSLKKSVLPEFWDDKKLQVKAREGRANAINHVISKKTKEILDLFYQFEVEDKPLTIETFHSAYSSTIAENKSYDFFTFFDKESEIQKGKITKGSLLAYRQVYNKLKDFSPSLHLSEIDFAFLNRFEQYLLTKGNLNRVTTHKLLKTLRTYLIIAFNKGMIKSNPFNKFKIKQGVSNRLFLDEAELQSIIAVKLPNEGEARARDLFIFACCTGLRFGDLNQLQWEDINNGMIRFVNQKTKHIISIPLIKRAEQILEKQDKTKPKIFRAITNQKYNEHLHTIEKTLEITKPLTSHIARHSFATLAITQGIPIEVVSSLLGHTNIKTTQIYAKIVDKLKIEQMKKFTI